MRSFIAILAIFVLATACGLKPDLPSQIPSTEVLGDDGYEVGYRWLVGGCALLLLYFAAVFIHSGWRTLADLG